MTGYFALDPRPLLPEDTQGTRVLLMGALGVTPYIDRALEVLELAERGNDPEHRALVIARDGTVAGLALFGAIAGTADGARLHTAVLAPGRRRRRRRRSPDARRARRCARRRRALSPRRDARRSGDRHRRSRCCAQHGFQEEARVPDFYRDGVALTLSPLESLMTLL